MSLVCTALSPRSKTIIWCGENKKDKATQKLLGAWNREIKSLIHSEIKVDFTMKYCYQRLVDMFVEIGVFSL